VSADTSRTGDEYAALEPLFEELAHAEGSQRERLREKLVTGYLPVANHIAQRFARRGQPLEDLEQVARLGLVNAVDRFDPARGHGFLSFAVPTVMGEVRRFFRDTAWMVRAPRRLQELHLRIQSVASDYAQQVGRAPTPSELSKALETPIDQVYEALEAAHAMNALSVESPQSDTDGGGATLGERLGTADPGFDHVDNAIMLKDLLSRLPERERLIVRLRFQEELTQSEIARRVGLSQMHISRLLTKTLAELRDALAVSPSSCG
jgi:RNA polymerase sigma-B factor